MIVEHNCIGSYDTSFHNFDVVVSGMTITISKGEIYRQGQIVFSSDTGATVNIPISDKGIEYNLIFTQSGLVVSQYILGSGEEVFIDGIIDKIAWFTVPANTITLDNLDIHVIKMTLDEVGGVK